jgi:4-oxalocrotonate tautomerase
MPLVDVSIVAGRTPEQIRDLMDRLTDAVEQALEVPRPSIRVLVRELPATHWAAGGETIAERERRSSPAAT